MLAGLYHRKVAAEEAARETSLPANFESEVEPPPPLWRNVAEQYQHSESKLQDENKQEKDTFEQEGVYSAAEPQQQPLLNTPDTIEHKSVVKPSKVLRFSSNEAFLVSHSLRDALQEMIGETENVNAISDSFLSTRRYLFLETLFTRMEGIELPPRFNIESEKVFLEEDSRENEYAHIVSNLEEFWDRLQ